MGMVHTWISGHLQIKLALFTVLWVADLAISRSAQVKASRRADLRNIAWSIMVCDVACTCLVFFCCLTLSMGYYTCEAWAYFGRNCTGSCGTHVCSISCVSSRKCVCTKTHVLEVSIVSSQARWTSSAKPGSARASHKQTFACKQGQASL